MGRVIMPAGGKRDSFGGPGESRCRSSPALPSLPWMSSQDHARHHTSPQGPRDAGGRQAGLEPRTTQDLKTVQVSNVL